MLRLRSQRPVATSPSISNAPHLSTTPAEKVRVLLPFDKVGRLRDPSIAG